MKLLNLHIICKDQLVLFAEQQKHEEIAQEKKQISRYEYIII